MPPSFPLLDPSLFFHRIRLPKGGVGRDYVLVQLTINGSGPYDFMLDSGERWRGRGWG